MRALFGKLALAACAACVCSDGARVGRSDDGHAEGHLSLAEAPSAIHPLYEAMLQRVARARRANIDSTEASLQTIAFLPGDAQPWALLDSSENAKAVPEGSFDWMRYNVVQMHAVVDKPDWFQPWRQAEASQHRGSGFAVNAHIDGDDDPVFITNAHVALNAKVLQVSMPALGQVRFDAWSPLICEDFDLAIVRLKDPAAFRKALNGQRVHEIEVTDEHENMGQEVAAVGFPLGSSTIKMSRGIISGTELVELVKGTVCFSSTAAISPGSSGGPLFGLDAEGNARLFGVNFATVVSAGSQSNNYVIPPIHILQILEDYRQGLAQSKTATPAPPQVMMLDPQGKQKLVGNNLSKGDIDDAKHAEQGMLQQYLRQMQANAGQFSHRSLKVPTADAVTTESNEALYASSKGCTQGVYLSKLYSSSMLRHATPQVEDESFLQSVGDATLDRFGMAVSKKFMGNYLPFESLLVTMNPSLATPINISTCKDGKVSQHSVLLTWDATYNTGVSLVSEPSHEPQVLDFEIFGEATFMQMTDNHLAALLASAPTLGRWLLPENQVDPHVLITDVVAGSYASRVLAPGMVVASVNGMNVSTLQDVRRAFVPSHADTWELRTERGVIYQVAFKKTLLAQLQEAASSPFLQYLATPGMRAAAEHLTGGLHRHPVLGPQLQAKSPNSSSPEANQDARNRVSLKSNRSRNHSR